VLSYIEDMPIICCDQCEKTSGSSEYGRYGDVVKYQTCATCKEELGKIEFKRLDPGIGLSPGLKCKTMTVREIRKRFPNAKIPKELNANNDSSKPASDLQ